MEVIDIRIKRRWAFSCSVLLAALTVIVVLMMDSAVEFRLLSAASAQHQLREAGENHRQPAAYGYSVLIISYHKTGHDLQMDLIDYITKEFNHDHIMESMVSIPHLSQNGNKSPIRRRRHSAHFLCSKIHVDTGTISAQHAPDLFCTAKELAHLLLKGGKGHIAERDRGVKIIHLVRNPFTMAVSNYHYHAQMPTPEAWVKFQNPCDSQYPKGGSFADVVLPALNTRESDKQQEQIVTREEFDSIVQDCLSLYRTTDRLKFSNFLAHLLRYDPPEGLRLATAEMMIQGYDNGGDILRMASNIMKLEQARQFVQDQIAGGGDSANNENNKELQVFTMSLDEFIARPSSSALEFFDFVLGENTSDSIRQRKEEMALKYENHYYKKVKMGESHITHTKKGGNGRDELIKYLRNDSVFGPPLRKIEALVETALETRRQQ